MVGNSTNQNPHTISRKGLGFSFEAEEAKKSKLLLHTQLLRERNQAIVLCTPLLKRSDLPSFLHNRIENYNKVVL